MTAKIENKKILQKMTEKKIKNCTGCKKQKKIFSPRCTLFFLTTKRHSGMAVTARLQLPMLSST